MNSDTASPPGSTEQPESESVTDWAGLKVLLHDVKAPMIIGAVIGVISSLLRLLPAVAITEIALHHNELTNSFVWTWLGIGAVGLFVGYFLYIGGLSYSHKVEARFRSQLRIKVVNQLSRIPLGWYAKFPSGAIKKIVRDDIAAVHTIVAHVPVDASSAAAMPLAATVILFYYDWRFALLCLLWILVCVVGSQMAMGQSMKTASEKYMSAKASMSQALVELVDGITTVKNFRGRTQVLQRFSTTLDEFTRFTRNWMRAAGKPEVIMLAIFSPAGMLIPVAAGGWCLVNWWGGDPLLMICYATFGLGLPVGILNLMPLMRFITQGAEASHRLSQLLEVPPLPVPDEPETLSPHDCDIVCGDVTFGYQADMPVITNLNLTFPAGSVTALVGPSGSGKTTLTRLIARFYDVNEGSIRIGGHDLRSLRDSDVLAQMAIVEQDVALIYGSVKDNIALGRPESTDEQIIAAARGAHIHERIEALPQGYDTILGSEQAHLSGGEKQRVALARAFLRDAPIVLLDEATAWADPHSQREIQSALVELTRGRTVIVVAHRLATITDVDNVVVFDRGTVVEQGTHQELVQAGGLYTELWEAQQ